MSQPEAKRRKQENEHYGSPPTNPLVSPLMTDLYQLSMAYAYWRSGRHKEVAVFDLFFRKNPFKGEFTVLAGVEEVLKFIDHYQVSESDIAYLKTTPTFCECDHAFFDWLIDVNMKAVRIYALKEGSACFPRVPLIRIEGPLAIIQLLETTLLCLVNYPSLMATNASRFRLAAGPDKQLLEFGLRRAQGPDGGVSASRYSFQGGFDATSHVLAGKLFGMGIKGTHAHSFITSFTSLKNIKNPEIKDSAGKTVDFLELCLATQKELAGKFSAAYSGTNESELAAFIDYAQAYPKGFLALIDTYDTLFSGLLNFNVVALSLLKIGHRPLGIRLDSGDLAYLSVQVRADFNKMEKEYGHDYGKLTVVASNDINENVLHSLNHQGHEIDCFGIGTHLVTCQAQPALGCVFKLVEIEGEPRIKLSADVIKTTLPGKKNAYRLYDKNGSAVLDYLCGSDEEPPQAGKQILCRHPFDRMKRVYVTPHRVESLLELVWDLSLIHISEPTRLLSISYAVFCLKKKKKKNTLNNNTFITTTD
eukprot:TRINITY_DN1067_c0_g1_i21.p1 TRINITY_DN1067_c0_g1~~TRINITY_DN1067_c0_g1_i21.p1  ORF type:complete len:532 (-),score=161.99 TRINITY_DN1067_c0_g1_i21:16-1611(-)